MSRSIGRGLGTLATALVGLLFIIPLLFLVITSLKSIGQVYALPFQWIPHPFEWSNFLDVFRQQPFGAYLWNSTRYASIGLLGDLLSCSLTGYAFVRYRSRMSDRLFYVVLALLLMPYAVLVVPEFIMFSWVHWDGTYLPLIVPMFFAQSSFLIFMFRQFFRQLPPDVFDAAQIDGCSPLRTFFSIVVPMSGPAFATAIVFSFAFTWGNFLGPVVFINQDNAFPVSVGLANFTAKYTLTPWNTLMAASIISILPSVIVFFLLQRRISGGFALGGIN
jgi:multiple sugar transport system permease protein